MRALWPPEKGNGRGLKHYKNSYSCASYSLGFLDTFVVKCAPEPYSKCDSECILNMNVSSSQRCSSLAWRSLLRVCQDTTHLQDLHPALQFWQFAALRLHLGALPLSLRWAVHRQSLLQPSPNGARAQRWSWHAIWPQQRDTISRAQITRQTRDTPIVH